MTRYVTWLWWWRLFFSFTHQPCCIQVESLKEKIEQSQKQPKAWQKLIYSGKILVDTNTIASYNIKEGEFLVLFVKPPKEGYGSCYHNKIPQLTIRELTAKSQPPPLHNQHQPQLLPLLLLLLLLLHPLHHSSLLPHNPLPQLQRNHRVLLLDQAVLLRAKNMRLWWMKLLLWALSAHKSFEPWMLASAILSVLFSIYWVYESFSFVTHFSSFDAGRNSRDWWYALASFHSVSTCFTWWQCAYPTKCQHPSRWCWGPASTSSTRAFRFLASSPTVCYASCHGPTKPSITSTSLTATSCSKPTNSSTDYSTSRRVHSLAARTSWRRSWWYARRPRCTTTRNAIYSSHSGWEGGDWPSSYSLLSTSLWALAKFVA